MTTRCSRHTTTYSTASCFEQSNRSAQMVEAAAVRANGVVKGTGAERSDPPVQLQRSLTFETLGNATVQFKVDGRSIFATDPWLKGTCYFGSWALDHPLTPEEIENVQKSPYIWISHGHP